MILVANPFLHLNLRHQEDGAALVYQLTAIDGRIRLYVGPAALAIDATGIGKTPGIQPVVFDPAGGLALSVGLRAFRVDRINRHPSFQELLDGKPLTGL